MSRGIFFEYNDKWIFEHREVYTNWKDLCAAYNKTFGTNYCYNTFKSHCNREMKLRSDIPYTEEQDKWLIENYPKLGRNKTTAEFNKNFNTNKNVNSIKIHCIRLGLKVSDERKRIRAVENTNRCHKPGTIVKKIMIICLLKSLMVNGNSYSDLYFLIALDAFRKTTLSFF